MDLTNDEYKSETRPTFSKIDNCCLMHISGA
jgi:hypothetical protein